MTSSVFIFNQMALNKDTSFVMGFTFEWAANIFHLLHEPIGWYNVMCVSPCNTGYQPIESRLVKKACGSVNTLRPRQNGRHIPDDILKCFSWMKIYKLWLSFHWSMFRVVHLIIFHHWFKYWLGAEEATNNYMKYWWLIFWRNGLNELTHMLYIATS